LERILKKLIKVLEKSNTFKMKHLIYRLGKEVKEGNCNIKDV
jgi:hypothetical protein